MNGTAILKLAQGYYISKPKPAVELTPWLLAQLSMQEVKEKV